MKIKVVCASISKPASGDDSRRIITFETLSGEKWIKITVTDEESETFNVGEEYEADATLVVRSN
jgi:hypothetical protein